MSTKKARPRKGASACFLAAALLAAENFSNPFKILESVNACGQIFLKNDHADGVAVPERTQLLETFESLNRRTLKRGKGL